MLAFEMSGRAGADRDTGTCSRDQLCRILGGLNEALHVCIQPSESSYLPPPPLFSARNFPLIVALLLSTCDAKCRAGTERESNGEKQDRAAEREGAGTSRQGESY